MTAPTQAPFTAIPDKAEIREEILSTQADFHSLVASLSDADFKQKSANPAWAVGQLVYHLAWGVGFIGGEIKSARTGKGFNPPQFVINPLNEMNTKFGAMRASRENIIARFDTGIERLLTELPTIGDDEWQHSSRNFGVTRTVEEVFRASREHVDDHAAEIRQGLGRT